MNLLFFLCILAITGCKERKLKEDLEHISGKILILPNTEYSLNFDAELRGQINAKWIICNRDTIIKLAPNTPKIVVFFNERGCQTCRLSQLYKWNIYIDEVLRDLSAQNDNKHVEFVFIFETGEDTHSLSVILQKYFFEYPVLCDRGKMFNVQNTLPKNTDLHCFLIDQKIVSF